MRDLAAGFEQATGNKVNVSFEAGNALNEKIDANAPADLVANTLDSFDDLQKRGKVVSGSVVEFARAGNGVAVKAGSVKRDISTPEAFKMAMLNSATIGHTNAGTGPFNTRLFQKLGIYDQVKGKVKIITGRTVAMAVAAGDVEIGIQQTNVIQPVAGTIYLGPAAEGADGIRPLRRRPADGVEGARGGEGLHQVHGRARERRPGAQERHGDAGELMGALVPGAAQHLFSGAPRPGTVPTPKSGTTPDQRRTAPQGFALHRVRGKCERLHSAACTAAASRKPPDCRRQSAA